MNMNWLDAIAHLAPFILPLIPGLPPVLIPFIVHGIQTAEVIPGASSATKLAAALDEVNTGIAALNALKPNTINPSLSTSAILSGINTTVAVANVVTDARK